jgi:hypothetical protein
VELIGQISGTTYAVAVEGAYAYVTGGLDGGLRIVNVADPAAPTEVGSYITPGRALDVAVAGHYAYLAASVVRCYAAFSIDAGLPPRGAAAAGLARRWLQRGPFFLQPLRLGLPTRHSRLGFAQLGLQTCRLGPLWGLPAFLLRQGFPASSLPGQHPPAPFRLRKSFHVWRGPASRITNARQPIANPASVQRYSCVNRGPHHEL